MSFLAPLFLLGAVTIALPVFFHLIRRSSKENLPFSSLIFLQPTPPRMTKRSRLEHLLLLLLRCLVICLLALGFSRPFLQKPMLAPQAADSGRKVILLLDRSASMRRAGLWEAALGRAEATLRQTGPGDQVAVYSFDNQVRPLIGFDQWAALPASERVPVTTRRLAEIQPGWAATQLGRALTRAAEAFAEGDQLRRDSGSRRIVLVTDLQEGARLDGLQGYEWPKGIEVQVEVVSPRKTSNAGIQWLAETADSTASEADTGPRLRVSNSANSQRESFQLRWNGVAGALPTDVYVPPGQNRIVAAPKLPPNVTGEQLVLSGDDDDFDNTVYLLPPKAEQIKVLYLGDEKTTDPNQPLFYLQRAFQATRQQNVVIAPHPTTTPLLPTELAATRLVLAADTLPAEQLAALQSFMTNGGTVWYVLKTNAQPASLGQLAGMAPALTVTDVAAPNYAMLSQIAFEHPLFASFADNRYNDFTKIHFWKYRRLDLRQFPGAHVLAKFDNGDPAFLEIPRGAGRLLVLTSGWQPADSQLALSSKFVPLLYAALELAGGIKGQITQGEAGEPVDLSGARVPGQSFPLVVTKPDGTTTTLAAGETRFTGTDLPGIYSVAAGGLPVRFAVNLAGAESRTAPLPLDELERLGVPMKPRAVDPAQQLEQKRRLHDTELESQQKLWRWLTLAALVLLLVETLVASRITNRTTVPLEGTL